MKRVVLIVAAGALLSVPEARADFLVGASAGQAGVEVEVSDPTFDIDFDEDDTAFSARVGWRFFKFFGVEAGYVDFGKPEGDVGSGVDLEADATGWDVYAVGVIPITRFEIFAKVGYFEWDLDADFSNGMSGGDDGSDFSYGIGFGLHILGPLHVRAEYEIFDVDVEDSDDSQVDMLSIGADLRF